MRLIRLATMVACATAFGQTTRPSFEVATIKPTDPEFRGILIGMPGGRFSPYARPIGIFSART